MYPIMRCSCRYQCSTDRMELKIFEVCKLLYLTEVHDVHFIFHDVLTVCFASVTSERTALLIYMVTYIVFRKF